MYVGERKDTQYPRECKRGQDEQGYWVVETESNVCIYILLLLNHHVFFMPFSLISPKSFYIFVTKEGFLENSTYDISQC